MLSILSCKLLVHINQSPLYFLLTGLVEGTYVIPIFGKVHNNLTIEKGQIFAVLFISRGRRNC